MVKNLGLLVEPNDTLFPSAAQLEGISYSWDLTIQGKYFLGFISRLGPEQLPWRHYLRL